MKARLFAPVLALVGSVVAAPTQTLQQSIINLENQIVYIINDMVQSSTKLESDYTTGMTEFNAVVKQVQGSKPCPSLTLGQPNSMDQAIDDLHMSQESLVLLALYLQNPAKSPEAVVEVCKAWNYYAAVAKLVGV